MELKQVNFSYNANHPLINQFSAKVPQGKILSIIGPNGAGKTTLLQLLTGQLIPDSGQVLVDNQPLADLDAKERATKIAIVSQQHHVLDEMTVSDVVKMGRRPFHSLLAVISDEEVAPFLEQVQLTKMATRNIASLSGGQQQRVWIAMALAQEPEYLFLDEPTTYLDVRYQTELMALIQKLQADKKMTVILILHDINQAMKISDEIWLLKDGQLIASGRPEQLLNESLLSAAFGMTVHVVTVPGYGQYVVQV